MRSQLTRSVFRRILANRPIAHRCCRGSPQEWTQRSGCEPHWALQRRQFWGLIRKQADEEYFTTEYLRHLEPGMKMMEDLSDALQQQTRPPDTAKLSTAFRDFFRSRDQSHSVEPLTEYHTKHLLATLNYLFENNNVHDEFGVGDDDLALALRVLAKRPLGPEYITDLVPLSTAIFEALTAPARGQPGESGADSTLHQPLPAEFYIIILSMSGKSEAALATLNRWSRAPGTIVEPHNLLSHIIQGFSRERKEQQAIKTIELLADTLRSNKSGSRHIFEVVFTSLLQMDNIAIVQKALNIWRSFGWKLSRRLHRGLLALSIRTNDLEWGKQFFQLTSEELDKDDQSWGLMLLWLAANGNGVEEMDRVIRERVPLEGKRWGSGPTIASINHLLAYANSTHNPYAAERYLAMGLKWGLVPDTETCLLQMEGRLNAKDLDGALACYKKLEEYEQLPNNKDLPVMNKLLRTLGSSRNIDYNLVLTILDKLLDRKVSLHPETVAALCELFIQRGELGEATDLLKRARLDLYSRTQRDKISNALYRLVIERKGKIMHTWQAYELLIKAFPEISVQARTVIMNSCFRLEQPDMACVVFGHMRQSQEPQKRPTADTYIECFQGLARHPDESSLQLVHNMLKLDTHVDLNTRLFNALMLAYMVSDSPQRSLEYWDEILNSQEGPTYNSIVIVLAACERALGGNRVARIIMQRLESLEIAMTREIYSAYLGALSGHGEIEDTFQLVEKMEGTTGLSPNSLILASVHNAAAPQLREVVREWTERKFPKIWEELLEIGEEESNEYSGPPKFKVDRIPNA